MLQWCGQHIWKKHEEARAGSKSSHKNGTNFTKDASWKYWKKLKIPSPWERREREDLIMMMKAVNALEWMDWRDLLARDDGKTRGNEYEIRKNRFVNHVKRFSFPNSTDIYNGLEVEVVWTKNIHNFKNRLDKSRYGHRTTCYEYYGDSPELPPKVSLLHTAG